MSKCHETNEKKITIHQKLCDAVKSGLREKFITIYVYLPSKEQKELKSITLSLSLKQSDEEQAKSKAKIRRK